MTVTDKMKILAFLALLFAAAQNASGQKFSASTNIMGYADFGTLNAEISTALAKNWTINAFAEYNPWTFKAKSSPMQNRKQSYALGVRYWPWHVYSGWWFSLKMQYQEYNRGGIFSPETEEGDAYGAAVSAGYTLMLTKFLNLEFGLGIWGGNTKYTCYSCPVCGRITDKGSKLFVLPDEIAVALAFVF